MPCDDGPSRVVLAVAGVLGLMTVSCDCAVMAWSLAVEPQPEPLAFGCLRFGLESELVMTDVR